MTTVAMIKENGRRTLQRDRQTERQRDREDAAGVSTCDGTESLRAGTVHTQQLLRFLSRCLPASNPPHFSHWRVKQSKKNNK